MILTISKITDNNLISKYLDIYLLIVYNEYSGESVHLILAKMTLYLRLIYKIKAFFSKKAFIPFYNNTLPNFFRFHIRKDHLMTYNFSLL